MKVTVIGAGNMGSAFVRQLVGAGHQVSVAARDAAKAAHVAAAHPGAVAVPAAGAAQGADVVVVATGYADAVAALRTADVQAGQTVIVNAIPGQDIVLEAAFDQAEVKLDNGNVVFEFANEVFTDKSDVIRCYNVSKVSNRFKAAAVGVSDTYEEVYDSSLIFRRSGFEVKYDSFFGNKMVGNLFGISKDLRLYKNYL